MHLCTEPAPHLRCSRDDTNSLRDVRMCVGRYLRYSVHGRFTRLVRRFSATTLGFSYGNDSEKLDAERENANV